MFRVNGFALFVRCLGRSIVGVRGLGSYKV